MKNLMVPNIAQALVLLGVTAVALWAAARRLEPLQAPSTRLAPVTVMAGQSQPQPAVTTGTHGGIGGGTARPPSPPGRLASAVDQAQHIFHELHTDGRHALCVVCDSQYGLA